MTVNRLQNFYYMSGNLQRDRRFYENILGFKVKFADGDHWVQFDVNGQNFALASDREAAPGAAGGVVVLDVDSIDGIVAKLAVEGVEIVAHRNMGSHGRTCAFKDPAGNIIQLFQKPA